MSKECSTRGRKQAVGERMMPACPRCASEQVGKNARIHNGKAKFACRACRRQVVEAPTKRLISTEMRALADSLLLERVPLAGMVRSTKVSPSWLQTNLNRMLNELFSNNDT